MLRTRQDLFDRAFALCLPLLEKAARRYHSGEVPTRIDHAGFSYPMLWILISKGDRPDDRERRERYRRRTEEFLAFFSHYFDRDGGMCAYGRSVSYRFAAVGAYGLAAAAGCRIRYGLAKRVILRNISYFFDNSIPTADGVLPPGYLYEALPFVENYTSDGSAYCYTQGFLALLNKENSPLWQSGEEDLPVERGNFLVQCPADGIGVVLEGNRRNGITLFNNSVHYYQEQYFDRRFNDMAGYYSKFAYNSRSGYSISTRDMVSVENMISLGTPDGRMTSHRQAIETIATSKELLISGQIPFSNDPETRITTWLLPLADGYHVRIHRLCLSQSYRVTEGGFSIGLRDDGFTAEDGVICYGAQISAIDAEFRRLTGEEPIRPAIKKSSKAAHPGMHLLAPRSICPCYETGDLPAGEYVSAVTVYYVTDGMMPENAPVITWNGNVISVTYGEIQRNVDVTAGRNG